ncbi:hypothetical protein GEMRC1_012237 [Eukaryota sp. GEM-RC1]
MAAYQYPYVRPFGFRQSLPGCNSQIVEVVENNNNLQPNQATIILATNDDLSWTVTYTNPNEEVQNVSLRIRQQLWGFVSVQFDPTQQLVGPGETVETQLTASTNQCNPKLSKFFDPSMIMMFMLNNENNLNQLFANFLRPVTTFTVEAVVNGNVVATSTIRVAFCPCLKFGKKCHGSFCISSCGGCCW